MRSLKFLFVSFRPVSIRSLVSFWVFTNLGACTGDRFSISVARDQMLVALSPPQRLPMGDFSPLQSKQHERGLCGGERESPEESRRRYSTALGRKLNHKIE